ncbi:MAG TPA: hypothetical protein VGM54_08250 [Chthoniobacter sp.]|jgi:hypothetical protein
MIRVVFITVTDGYFFPGTVATVHSIRAFHPTARIVVAHNHVHKRGVTAEQRAVLERAGAQWVEAAELAKPGRKVAAWELKAYGASDLTVHDDVLVGIDSDCVLCGPIDDIVDEAMESGAFHGGKDGAGKTYDATYAPYGMKIPSRNNCYMSTSLYVCALTEGNRAILREWAQACDQAIFGGGKVYPGHGDQGVLNAVLWARRGAAGVRPLDNRLWSQHGCYWQAPVGIRDGRLFNELANLLQRTLHCGGGDKFWSTKHRDRVVNEGRQHSCYAWFLALLWSGTLAAEDLSPGDRHLVESRELFRPQVDAFLRLLRASSASRLAPC